MKQNSQGLWVPDNYQEPPPRYGGWPPVMRMPADAKTSHVPVPHTECMGLVHADRWWGTPGRGIEQQS